MNKLAEIPLDALSEEDFKQIEEYINSYKNFPVVEKLQGVVGKYKVFTKDYLSRWIDGMSCNEFSQSKIDSMGFTKLKTHFEHISRNDATLSLTGYNPRNTDLPTEPDEIISRAVLDEDLNLHKISITETRLEDYKGLPPLEVDQALGVAKKDFEEFTVLDVKKEELQNILDDPILVGKLSILPDYYFFIAGWEKDHDINLLLKANT